MKLQKDTLVITNEEIGERLNYFVSLFCSTMLGSKSTHDKLTIYYADGGKIEVTYYKGKELDFTITNGSNERIEGSRTKSTGWINEKANGYCYWQKCSVDRIEFIYW